MKLVKVSTEWCAPCKMLKSQMIGFNACELEEIDASLDPDKVTELQVRGVPTLILFNDDGEEVWRNTGVIAKAVIEQKVKQFSK